MESPRTLLSEYTPETDAGAAGVQQALVSGGQLEEGSLPKHRKKIRPPACQEKMLLGSLSGHRGLVVPVLCA